MIRRLLVLLAIVPLFGAAEMGLAPPIVVVYPLTATGDVGSAQTGSNIAAALANKLALLGGVTVKPFVAGTTRQQYLTAAISESADYYITGYLTPLGSEVSVLEQVVSTRSGSIVYSTTAFAKTYADAVGPADDLRQAILRHAGRGMASLDAPPPSPSPEAIGSGGGVNITKAFGRHHKGTAAAPSASPAPRVASAPSQAQALVIATGGSADTADKTYASQSLSLALKAQGIKNAVLSVDAREIAAHGADLCKANAASGFYAATLGETTGAGRRSAPNVRLDVAVYDCNGTLLTNAGAGAHGAVRGAIDAAAAHVANALASAHPATTPATPRAAT